MRGDSDGALRLTYIVLITTMLVLWPKAAFTAIGIPPWVWGVFVLTYWPLLPLILNMFGLLWPARPGERGWQQIAFEWHLRSCVWLIGICILLHILDWIGVF